MRLPIRPPRPWLMRHGSAAARGAEWGNGPRDEHPRAAAIPWNRPLFRLRNSAEDHPETLRCDVAQGEQHAGPHEGRDEVRDLKTPERHFENPRDERHRGAERAGEAPDKDAERAPLLDEGLALGDEVRRARQRAEGLHPLLELAADPVGEPVPERRPDRTRAPDRPEAEFAGRN